MTVPLNRFLVLVAAALTLLAVMLSTAYAVYAQSGGYSCAAGEAVADLDNNPGLVSDCTALLAAQDNLAEGSGLDWSVDIPMSEWDGVTLSGPDDDAAESPPRRLIELDLGFKELTGEAPSQLAELTNLESLSLRNNEFTGQVPSWIAGLANLESWTCDATSLPAPSPPGLAASST